MSDFSTKDAKNTKDTKRTFGNGVELTAKRVIGAVIEVHRTLGPGHPERVYELALAVEMELRGIRFQRQAIYSVAYTGRPVGEWFVREVFAGHVPEGLYDNSPAIYRWEARQAILVP